MQDSIVNLELALLAVLREAGAPLSRAELQERAGVDAAALRELLNDMLNKGLIEDAGFVRSGNTWRRLFAPAQQ